MLLNINARLKRLEKQIPKTNVEPSLILIDREIEDVWRISETYHIGKDKYKHKNYETPDYEKWLEDNKTRFSKHTTIIINDLPLCN